MGISKNSDNTYTSMNLGLCLSFRRCNLFELLPLPLSGSEENQMDHSRLHFLVTGYQQLHRAQILLPALEQEVKRSTYTVVYDSVIYDKN